MQNAQWAIDPGLSQRLGTPHQWVREHPSSKLLQSDRQHLTLNRGVPQTTQQNSGSRTHLQRNQS